MTMLPKPQAYAHIKKTPGVCGGQPVVDDTRVRVKNLAVLAKQGRTPQQIAEDYPGLTLGQIHAALTYYYDNPGEIEAAIVADEQAFDELNRYWREHVLHTTASPAARGEQAAPIPVRTPKA